jgi:serpin B
LFAAAAVSVAAFGCSGGAAEGGAISQVRSDLQRETRPDVSITEQTEFVADQTSFAIDFYKRYAAGQKGNVVVSPHSIAAALAMTYAGASGDTQTEMQTALHFGLGPERVHPAFNWMDLQLASRGKGASGKDGKPQRIAVNNALFGEKTLHFEKPFLDKLAVNYDAGMKTVDFKNAPDSARIGINGWVEDQTEGKIKDLLGQGSISHDARLVLVNTIYLNAAWQSKFTAESTSPGPFASDAGSLSVPTMHQTAGFASEVSDNETAVELPYEGGDLAMLVVMPAAGTIDAYEASLTTKSLGDVVSRLASGEVDLALPKFKLEPGTVKLSEQLQAMGMPKAFSDAADFSAITKDEPLRISEVHHKAFIDVDEAGTEAAAATAVVIGKTSAMSDEPRRITVDRPFLFLLRDHQTGQILFMGRVTNPKG